MKTNIINIHHCNTISTRLDSRIRFKSIKYKRRECSVCGYITTYPLIKDTKDIYETGHYTVRSHFKLPLAINAIDYSYITYIIYKHLPLKKKSVILDFGCGKGLFLYFLKTLNFNELYGVETSKSRATFAKGKTNIKISTEAYTKGTIFDRRYDCVTLIHVLEHINKPFILINNILKDLLVTDGVVFIEVPNINAISYKISGKYWAHYTPHFHINHFTIGSLINYCHQNNLCFKLLSTFSFYNGGMGMTSGIFALLGYKGVLFEDVKSMKLKVIIPLMILFPIMVITELIVSIITQRGTVIKCVIKKDILSERKKKINLF